MNLKELALKYGTDKEGEHFYCQHYENHFEHLRNNPISLLEIGVGGYEKPNKGGESLRMWKEYFPKAQIYSIDIFDKSGLQEDRIKIFKGSQVDTVFLDSVMKNIGHPDIIIDDGSHINAHIIMTFKYLFQYLKDGGVYVVEDLQTSYWKDYGGNKFDLDNKNNAMAYFRSLADGLNWVERKGYEPDYFDLNITSIHFYHNMVFIYKGKNNEPSNVIK